MFDSFRKNNASPHWRRGTENLEGDGLTKSPLFPKVIAQLRAKVWSSGSHFFKMKIIVGGPTPLAPVSYVYVHLPVLNMLSD